MYACPIHYNFICVVQVVPCLETSSLLTAGSPPVDPETPLLTVSLGTITVTSELPYTVCVGFSRSLSVSSLVVSGGGGGVLRFLDITQMSSITKIAKITITPMTGPTISRASVGMSALGVEVLRRG